MCFDTAISADNTGYRAFIGNRQCPITQLAGPLYQLLGKGGAAQEAAQDPCTAPATVQQLLAHRGPEMQRRYLGAMTRSERDTFDRMSAARATRNHGERFATSTSTPTSASASTTSARGPPRPGAMMVARTQTCRQQQHVTTTTQLHPADEDPEQFKMAMAAVACKAAVRW